MTKEVIKYLAPQSGKFYVDATVGLGGHTKEILQSEPNAKVLAIDWNEKSLNQAKDNLSSFGERVIFANDNFSKLAEIIKKNDIKDIDGILLDLGLASWQIDEGGIGITFSKEEDLDMRYFTNRFGKQITAKDVINKFSIKELADIFYKYGDVRGSWGAARKIEVARKEKEIKTTLDLVEALKIKNPKFLAPIFQALRIYVNNEYKNLEEALLSALEIVDLGGKIVVISFHSGEDRIAKNIFRDNKDKFEILTKKPISASKEEISINSRARSAKLRAIKKIKN